MRKIIFFLLLYKTLFGCDTPYSQTKFHTILDGSKLQAPLSAYNPLYSVKYGEFKDVCNQYFYLQDRKYMAFAMCGKKRRSELRTHHEWRVESQKKHTLFAKLKIFPLNQVREFTFLQIHADSNRIGKNGRKINKPLLRLTWWHEQKNLYNHLWAVIRLTGDVKQQKYTKIDLGLRPKDFFTVKIEVQNAKMKIYINGRKKIAMDVSYWSGYWNYFKAGVYNQDEGCAKSLFENLR